MKELNKELMLAHNFLKQQYETYLKSEQIKSNEERRSYAHAIHIIGYIAYNTHITTLNNKKQLQKIKQLQTTKDHTDIYNMTKKE